VELLEAETPTQPTNPTNPTQPTNPTNPTQPTTPSSGGGTPSGGGGSRSGGSVVRTGDTNNSLIWYILIGAAGIVILGAGITLLVSSKRREKKEQ